MINGFLIERDTVYEESTLTNVFGLSREAVAEAVLSGELRCALKEKQGFYLGSWIIDWLEKMSGPLAEIDKVDVSQLDESFKIGDGQLDDVDPVLAFLLGWEFADVSQSFGLGLPIDMEVRTANSGRIKHMINAASRRDWSNAVDCRGWSIIPCDGRPEFSRLVVSEEPIDIWDKDTAREDLVRAATRELGRRRQAESVLEIRSLQVGELTKKLEQIARDGLGIAG